MAYSSLSLTSGPNDPFANDMSFFYRAVRVCRFRNKRVRSGSRAGGRWCVDDGHFRNHKRMGECSRVGEVEILVRCFFLVCAEALVYMFSLGLAITEAQGGQSALKARESADHFSQMSLAQRY